MGTALLLALAGSVAGASAQERPLRTEDPVPVPRGIVLVESGIDLLADRSFPLSGLSGTLARIPAVGFRIGFGRTEFRVSGGYQALFVESRRAAPLSGELEVDGDVAADVVDPVVATKIQLQHERGIRPAVGVRLATKLPSASNENGLGTDAIDVFVSLLAGKDLGATRVMANLGFGILSIPTRGDRQNDVLVYGVALERPVGEGWEVVAEIAGREDVKGDTPAGTEDLGQARLGARWSLGEGWTVDGAALFGLNDADGSVGATVGASWRVRGFDGG